MWARDASANSDAAVIDVGSNSVRLVVYRLEGRAIWTVYNEKVLAGLGRDLRRTGALFPEGVVSALGALRRFKAVLEAIRPAAVYAVATAAVREASDGAAFVQRVRDETGVELRVISGEDEARYSALGVVAGAPESAGVAGDLGGYSLELVRIAKRRPGVRTTLPLGPFALGPANALKEGEVRRAVTRALEPVENQFRSDCFYAVGGAWRNLGLLHMRLGRYPLEILHQYDISARDAVIAARFVSQQSKSSLERIEGLSKKRLETLPHAALVLEAVVEQLGVKTVQISAYGLREGLLFDAMSRDIQARNPLLEGCAALGARQDAAEELGTGLEAWMAPAFAKLDPVLEPGRDGVLLAAACRLADLGTRLHPDHRAQLVFEQVLRAPVAGMNHAERAYLACAVFARHTASANIPEPGIVERLLSIERLQRARALGAAIRLGCDLSGRSVALLARSSLEFQSRTVVLRASPETADILLGEQTARRGQTLASLLDRELRVEAK
jgi:exopolyphosphatase/guanosine-5'-triphosphate,3'-diphosphate pyrophosphatase